ADAFYKNIWGGEDIHIGIYEPLDEPIATASRRTVAEMASMLKPLDETKHVLDLGAGYGGSARYLAEHYGCRVTCLNLSETQNALNREKNSESGLADKIDVVHGNFEDVPEPDEKFDVVWSQDAILHSGDRIKVLEEVKRLLRPNGHFIFTDPMQRNNCPKGVLQPILDRIHLETLGSFDFYRNALLQLGFKKVEMRDLTKQLRNHYHRVSEELSGRRAEMLKLSGTEYVENMLKGLKYWVDGADKEYLAWGIMHFQRSA
ncbi:MAG: SAM-dependent methyltransferase, partial [Rhodospirillales bacterium]